MMKNTIYAFLMMCFVATSQENIRFVMIGESTVIQEIEVDIIHNLISIYNRRNNAQLTYEIDTVGYFHSMFDALDKIKNLVDKNHVVAISSISNTMGRRKLYDFSSIYLPSKDVIFTLKSNENEEWRTKGTRIGYQIKTTMEKHIINLKKSHNVVGVKYKAYRERFDALLNKTIDFSLADNVELWKDKQVKIIHEIEVQSSLGISMMYPKGSKLKDRLDKYLKYYTKSPKFLMLIHNKFGKDISAYFRKNL